MAELKRNAATGEWEMVDSLPAEVLSKLGMLSEQSLNRILDVVRFALLVQESTKSSMCR